MLKDMDFCHSGETYLTDIATKTGLDALKTPTKKVAHKAAEASGELIENKILNPKSVPDEVIKQFNCIKVCNKKINRSK